MCVIRAVPGRLLKMDRLSCKIYGPTLLVLLCELKQVASALWALVSSPIKPASIKPEADRASSCLGADNLHPCGQKEGAATHRHRHGPELFLTSDPCCAGLFHTLMTSVGV